MFCKKISIAVLGSTGSIGKTTLKILNKYKKNFKVDLLAFNSNDKIALLQIKKFLPKFVIIKNTKSYNLLKRKKYKKKIKFFKNLDEFKKNNNIKFDKVVLGVSSIDGLEYAFAFLNYSNEILIANKETIVCGGKFFLNKAKKLKCTITSIDSEHYCIKNSIKFFKRNMIDKVYLTASGGPFLKKKNSQIAKIDPKFALDHPNWKMGKKISIDSATMANKGLEVIEASILFNLSPKQIKIKIHKESKVHSIITLKNGMVHLVAHNTSMTIPIENSLVKNITKFRNNNFFYQKKIFNFSFDEINLKKFKMLNLAYKALVIGPRACILFNVINDFLVELYLNKKIFFYEIFYKLNKVFNLKNIKKNLNKKINKVDDIYETIHFAKELAKKI